MSRGKPGQPGNLNGAAAIKRGYPKGVSGNPGGRPNLTKVVIAAGYNPKELRPEIVKLAVEAVRNPDTDPASWRYAHDYCAGVLGIRPPKEMVIEDERRVEIDETQLTDEQLDQAIDAAEKLVELGVLSDEGEQDGDQDEPPVTH